MDGGQPVRRGFDLQMVLPALILVAADAVVGFRGERENGMRHGGHVPLGGRVKNIADKEIALLLAIRQQRRAGNGGDLSPGKIL